MINHLLACKGPLCLLPLMVSFIFRNFLHSNISDWKLGTLGGVFRVVLLFFKSVWSWVDVDGRDSEVQILSATMICRLWSAGRQQWLHCHQAYKILAPGYQRKALPFPPIPYFQGDLWFAKLEYLIVVAQNCVRNTSNHLHLLSCAKLAHGF